MSEKKRGFTYARRVTKHGRRWLGSVVGLAVVVLGLTGITASGILAFAIHAPAWIPPSVLAGTFVMTLQVGSYLAWREENARSTSLDERLSRLPLDPKHEEQLRSVIPKLSLTNSGYEDELLIAQLFEHTAESDVWGIRDQLLSDSANQATALEIFNATIAEKVRDINLTSCLGAIREVLLERLSQLQQGKDEPGPPWPFSPVSEYKQLFLDGHIVALVEDEEQARIPKHDILTLWTDVATWRCVQVMIETKPRIDENKRKIHIRQAILESESLDGTTCTAWELKPHARVTQR
jgi:hypothetical protein